MQEFSFTIRSQDKCTLARTGVLHTPHGDIHTPAFVPVGSQASIKSLSNEDILSTGTSLWFINTYHMYLRPGLDVLRTYGGVHAFTGWKGPIITDSGGFQVFSLGAKRLARLVSDAKESGKNIDEGVIIPLVRIDDEGVTFQSHWDGTTHRFTPEKSLEIQSVIGSDIALVFDECTPYPTDGVYARISLDRTHAWALRSLTAHEKYQKYRKHNNLHTQAVYGIIQGSIYESLRIESAKFIASLPFDGIAIGGVSVGETKKEMRVVADWVIPHLPPDKPRHLLGVGEIDDIFALVRRGIDTFDCVQPTRLARVGYLYSYTRNQEKNDPDQLNDYVFNISLAKYRDDLGPIDHNCTCFTCRTVSLGYMYHLFKAKELLAYRLASIHNIAFIQSLVAQIREAVAEGTLVELEKKWGYTT